MQCRVPPTFDVNNRLVLYEPDESSTNLEQLSVGEGLLEISLSRWPCVSVPFSNHTKHEIILPKRTTLGTIQHVVKVFEMGKEAQPAKSPQHGTVRAEVDSVTAPEFPPSKLWQPLVDRSHLNPEQQEVLKKMLYEESAAFAQDRNNIGCIPSLQMSIRLKDDIPVQRAYTVGKISI